MRPESERYWRKAARRALRRPTGRRDTHRQFIEPPRRGSTWLRRHPGQFEYWLAHAGTTRLLADLKTDTTKPPACRNAEGSTPASSTSRGVNP